MRYIIYLATTVLCSGTLFASAGFDDDMAAIQARLAEGRITPAGAQAEIDALMVRYAGQGAPAAAPAADPTEQLTTMISGLSDAGLISTKVANDLIGELFTTDGLAAKLAVIDQAIASREIERDYADNIKHFLRSNFRDAVAAPRLVLNREDSEYLVETFNGLQRFDDADVHAFNRALGGVWDRLNQIFTQVLPEFRARPVRDVEAEMSAFIVQSQLAAKASALQSAWGTFNSYPAVEGKETKLNTQVALSMLWYLASSELLDGKRMSIIGTAGEALNLSPREFILHSVLENAATRGGCHPGYAGRFIRDMLILLSNLADREARAALRG